MEVDSALPHLIGLTLILGLSAFFSGSETAMFSLSKVQIQRLRQNRDNASRAVVRFYDDLKRLLATVLIGNNFVNIAFASITGSLFMKSLGSAKGAPVAVAFNLLMLLTFGEITPKVYAMKYPERFAMKTARPLWWLSVLFYPAYWILRFITDLILPKGMELDQTVTPEEIKALLYAGAEEGEFEEDERELIQVIFDLRDIEAHEIMVPRTEVVCADASETIGGVLKKAKDNGYSRIPIYRDDFDDICGVFYAKDLPIWHEFDIMNMTVDYFMTVRSELIPERSDTLIRRPNFVPENRKIGDLLRDFLTTRSHMAILVDEYGGFAGIVTLEDIIEELVGDIVDEYDEYSREEEITRLPDGTYEVLGRTTVRTLNRELKLALDEEIADTVGGYVFDMFGRVPEVGATIEKDGITWRITRIKGMRIERLHLAINRSEMDDGKHQRERLLSLLMFAVGAIVIGWTGSAWANAGETWGFNRSIVNTIAFAVLSLLLVGVRAYYAGSETAFVSANKIWIKSEADQGNRDAQRALSLFVHPEAILTTTLIGTNLMGISAAQMAVLAVKSVRPDDVTLQSLISSMVMPPIFILFGEIIPKSLFKAKANVVITKGYPILRGSYLLLYPVVKLFVKISTMFASLMKKEEQSARRSELKLMASIGEEHGALKPQQRQMIHSVLNLKRKQLGKVMVPLVEIISVRKGTPISTFLKIAAQHPYSRYPVYADRIDNIIGIVHMLDVIYADNPSSSIDVFIRDEITYVPESKHVDTFLKEFQSRLIGTSKDRRIPMAFVVDEYGGVVGLVTIADLIEEITGSIQDERGGRSCLISVTPREIICLGRTEVEFLNMQYGMDIPEGNYETIAGYLIHLSDRIPEQGETIDAGMFRYTIVESDARSIKKVRIVSKGKKFRTE